MGRAGAVGFLPAASRSRADCTMAWATRLRKSALPGYTNLPNRLIELSSLVVGMNLASK